MEFNNRRYTIVPTAEIDRIDFAQVLETSAETCRYSVAGDSTFVKYESAQPASVASVENRSDEYTHAEILEILSGDEWSAPIEEGENVD